MLIKKDFGLFTDCEKKGDLTKGFIYDAYGVFFDCAGSLPTSSLGHLCAIQKFNYVRILLGIRFYFVTASLPDAVMPLP
jgi:hypothetical protein